MDKMSKVVAALAGMAMAGAAMAADPVCEMTSLQVAAGYVTFANLVKFLAAGAGAVFSGIFLFHIRGLFTSIPVAIWKALGYAVVAALCAGSMWAAPSAAPYAQFVGALLGAGALLILLGDMADLVGSTKKDERVWEAAVAVGAGILAVTQGNAMVAGVAVAGLMALLGFSVFSAPGLVAMGFDGKGGLWKATFGALAVLVPATIYRLVFGTMGQLEIFWPAIGWLCTMVASIGLLIASSRFFESRGAGLYIARNVAMLAFSLFCIWAGSVHGMVEMQRVAGTLLVVWLFEKPWDIPKAGLIGYSFIGALSCGGIFLLMQEVSAHPERWSNILLF
jgi:hypothetical protein